MGATTSIEWADATWNPLVGCTKVSPGCDHCYAETFVNRFAGKNLGFPNRFDVVTMRGQAMLRKPMTWRGPRRVFVNSLSDLFHADVPVEFIAQVFAVMAATPRHTYQLLTKRHGRMRSLLNDPVFAEQVRLQLDTLVTDAVADRQGLTWPLPNLWLGVSAEDQQRADLRIPFLLHTPAAVRWVSAEPLLGPLSLHSFLGRSASAAAPSLDWVVVGGESGPGSRPMLADWVRDARAQCEAQGVAFLFKQWGSHNEFGEAMSKQAAGRLLDGRTHDGYPAADE